MDGGESARRCWELRAALLPGSNVSSPYFGWISSRPSGRFSCNRLGESGSKVQLHVCVLHSTNALLVR